MIKKLIVHKYNLSPPNVARFEGDCNSLKVFDTEFYMAYGGGKKLLAFPLI